MLSGRKTAPARTQVPLPPFETHTMNLSSFLHTPEPTYDAFGGQEQPSSPEPGFDGFGSSDPGDRAEALRRTAARFAGNSARTRCAFMPEALTDSEPNRLMRLVLRG